MKVKRSNPPSVHAPTGAYTHVVSVEKPSKILFISGQVGKDHDGKVIASNVEAQAKQAFTNLVSILKSEGGSFSDVVKLNIYTTLPEQLPLIRKARDSVIPPNGLTPASTFIGIASLSDKALLIEVEAIAVLK